MGRLRVPRSWLWAGAVSLIAGTAIGGVASWIAPSPWVFPLRVLSSFLTAGPIALAVIAWCDRDRGEPARIISPRPPQAELGEPCMVGLWWVGPGEFAAPCPNPGTSYVTGTRWRPGVRWVVCDRHRDGLIVNVARIFGPGSIEYVEEHAD